MVLSIFIIQEFLTPVVSPNNNFNKNFELNQSDKGKEHSVISKPQENPLDKVLVELLNKKTFSDFALSFDSAAKMDTFLNKRDFAGLKLLSSIPQILTARFRVLNATKAAEALSSSDAFNSVDFNVPVYRPKPLRINEEEISSGSPRTVGEALSLDVDRTDWGRGTKVAILDSEIDFSHPSLIHLKHEKISMIDSNRQESENYGHGTAIASIISGALEGYEGLAPSAEILSIEVLDSAGVGDAFSVAEAIVIATDRGSDVINLSLGGEMNNEVLQNAVNYAASKDVLVVAAVGNDGSYGISFPARYKDVIGVAALNSQENIANFSNSGPGVDISAPGENLLSVWADGDVSVMNGTSSAAAVMSGALAAEISRNPLMSRTEVKDLLYAYSNEVAKPGFDEMSGHGALNLQRVINRNVADYNDAAIVGYYFDPENLKNLGSVGTIPFTVTIQNQGSTWLNEMDLEIQYRGLGKKFHYNNLSPGQTRSEVLYIESSDARNGIEITSRLKLVGKLDANPQNNQRNSRLILPGLD